MIDVDLMRALGEEEQVNEVKEDIKKTKKTTKKEDTKTK